MDSKAELSSSDLDVFTFIYRLIIEKKHFITNYFLHFQEGKTVCHTLCMSHE